MTTAAMPAALAEQQRRLAALITGDDDTACADDAPATNALLRALADSPPRLAIYRHAYRGRLASALRENYPVLHRVLGDDDFAALAHAYLADHPSREASIRWFGHALPDWIAARDAAGDAVVPHPALADLARMEWALGTSFDSADATPLAAIDLAGVPADAWPGLRFAPHPSLRLLRLAWAVQPLWQALTDDADAATSPPARADHAMVVWRRGLDTRWHSLPDDEAAVLGACLAGEPFGALCERIAAADDAPARAVAWLRAWLDAGWLLLQQE